MYKLTPLIVLSLIAFTHCSGQDRSSNQKVGGTNSNIESNEFETRIRPLLMKYCADCHSPGEMDDLEFLVEMTDAEVSKHRGLFAAVVEQMEAGSMPPKDFDQPTEGERTRVTSWLKKKLDLEPSDTERIAPYVVEVYEDRKGNLWFGTVQQGAARYDGKTLTYFSEKDGLPSNAVPSFAEDQDGNLWVGTHGGVAKFDGQSFSRVGIAAGLPAQARPSAMAWGSVKADQNGVIWASVGSQIFRLEGTTFKEFKTPIVKENIKSFAIVSGRVSLKLVDRQGNLWFGTDGDGAYKFDGESFTHFTKQDGLCSNNITSIIEDKQGNIWFTCIQSYQPKMTGDGGLCRFDGKTFTKFPKIQGLSKNDLYSIYETREGDIWIGASGVGAYRYDGSKFSLFRETDRPHATRNFGVQSILQARNGTLWFGFSGGLFRFNGRSFYNITKDGPWEGLAILMSKIVVDDSVKIKSIHPDAHSALVAISNGKFDQAKSMLLELKQKNPSEITIQERSMTMLGYQLMNMKKLDLAIEVLKINTSLHPMHFNTFDSLGEAYLRNGDEQLGIENYQKSLELNPQNESATLMLKKVAARKAYEDILDVPEGWLEEVIVVPPNFAPTMSLVGMEHLRLPPEFRNPDSDWFCTYCFAIDLSEPIEANEEFIAQQLLVYFRGLSSGRVDAQGNLIDTEKFSIKPQRMEGEPLKNQYSYVLRWQEPFVAGTPLKQNIRVQLITGKNEHGVLFICCSPKQFGSGVWKDLLEIRSKFER